MLNKPIITYIENTNTWGCHSHLIQDHFEDYVLSAFALDQLVQEFVPLEVYRAEEHTPNCCHPRCTSKVILLALSYGLLTQIT